MKRLVDSGARQDQPPELAPLAALFRAAPPADHLDDRARDRLHRQFFGATQWTAPRRTWRWSFALPVFLISSGVGAAGMRLATGHWPLIESRGAHPEPPVETKAPHPRVARPHPPSAAWLPAITPPPAAAPAPAPPESGAKAARRRGALGAGAPPEAPATPPGPLAEEARLLESALQALRVDRDPAAALAAVDLYLTRFPSGLLRSDALHLQVDGLLVSGRHPEALATLRALPLEAKGRDVELLIVRGELGMDQEPAAAMRDFDRALAVARSGALAERALYGRAVALARMGSDAAAREGFAEYLRRFPDGRFATAARSYTQGP